MKLELGLDENGNIAEVSTMHPVTVTRCKNCDDPIVCIEGVKWLHEWMFEFKSTERGIVGEYCLWESWERKNGRVSRVMLEGGGSIAMRAVYRAEPPDPLVD